MEKTAERQKKPRLPYIESYDINLLPIASIYGGNASGKSNFVKALRFAQNIIVRGMQIDELIPVEPFLLDGLSSKSSEFVFVISVDDHIYEYGFKINKHSIVEEWLIKILKTTESEVFRRNHNNVVNFNSKYSSSQRLKYAAEGTRKNQLFLTNTVSQNIKDFENIYYWFKNRLVILEPHTKFHAYNEFTAEKAPLKDLVNSALQGLDTGVQRIGEESIPLDSVPHYSKIKEEIEKIPAKSVTNLDLPNGEKYVLYNKNGEDIEAVKIVSYHSNSSGVEKKFDFTKESDGTKRVIDLLPAFIESSQADSGKVYIIDELDRSLHSLLVKRLLQTYLNSCSKDSRSQLIFTTHDLMLIDQNLLRRDEMWVMERDKEEASKLYSISDYKDVRNDKDIRKSYIQGRFGGVPRILLVDSFSIDSLWNEKGEDGNNEE
ncbi:MAG: ATP-binding protein [Victivallales bacterium]|nr:ATP-binding protein [Victivallales bacterium]